MFKKEWKNAQHNFPQPNISSSSCVFCQQAKTQGLFIIIINGKEKQQILKFKKLQPANVLAWNITKAMTLTTN